MVQVPTDCNIADINAKPFGGPRIRYFLNLIGYWRSEDQIKGGAYERREYEEKKNFAGKVNKIAKRMVALEGLQPMVTEAFLKVGNTQCGLGAVEKSNEEWKIWIVIIIAFQIVGFAAVIFVTFKTYKHVKALHAD